MSKIANYSIQLAGRINRQKQKSEQSHEDLRRARISLTRKGLPSVKSPAGLKKQQALYKEAKKPGVLTGKKLADLRSKNKAEALAAGGKEVSIKDILRKKNFTAEIDRPIGKYRGGKGWAGMVYPINYGEIPGLINPNDGDPWDIIIPGPVTPKKKIKVRKIIGYVPLTDGNHKLIGVHKAKTRINLKQVVEFIKRRKRQGEKNGDVTKVLDPVIIP